MKTNHIIAFLYPPLLTETRTKSTKMKFIVSSIALASLASAKVALTNSDFSDIEAGKPFEITWAEATGPVTITLKSGASDNLSDVAQIASKSRDPGHGAMRWSFAN